MDVAALGLEIRSEQVKQGSVELDKLTNASKRAEAAVTSVSAASKRAESATLGLSAANRNSAAAAAAASGALANQAAAAKAAETALMRAAKAARFAANNQRMLMYQLVDVGQALATAPTMGIYALQNLGFQFAQIGQMYAGNGGLKAALSDSAAMVGRFAAKLGPLAAVVAVVGGAFAGLTYEINRTTKVSVGLGDTLLATLQVARDGIYSILKPAIDAISPWFAAAWDLVVAGVKLTNNVVIKGWQATFATLGAGIRSIPDAFIVAGESAANGFLKAIEYLVNKALGGIQQLIDGVESFAASYGGDKLKAMLGWERLTPQLYDPSKPFKIDNADFGGAAAAKRLKEGAEAYKAELKAIAASDPMGDFFNGVRSKAIANALDDPTKKKKHHGKTDGEKFSDIVRDADAKIAALRAEQAGFGQTAEAAARLLYEQELLNKATQAGLSLDPQQIALLKAKAAEMASVEAATKAAKAVQDAWNDAGKSFGGILKGLLDGTISWKDALLQTIPVVLKLLDTMNLAGGGKGIFGGGFFQNLLGGLLGVGFANGGVFQNGAVTAFARGGVVNTPTVFPMAKGLGLMGESGPEAIMPLRRGPDGRLGVSGPANSNQPQIVEIRVSAEEGKMFRPVIRAESRDVSVRVVQAAAPGIMQGGATATQNAARNRPGFFR